MELPVIRTKYGDVQGVSEKDCIVYKGIPYAKPPVGALRWRAPQAPEPWEGIYYADHFSCRSAQPVWGAEEAAALGDAPAPVADDQPYVQVDYTREFYQDAVSDTPVSEDSLYLNIWVPKDAGPEPLPVAFYIHGGAFMGGNGAEVEFRTDAYARENVILVTINYRLGIMGFFAHPSLTEEDPYAVGNYGILDQLAALDWVRENIAAFGGDPDNITVFGQSAGCISVQVLLSVPAAQGKFSRAILQSGAGYPNVLANETELSQAYTFAEIVMRHLNVSTVDEMRERPVEALIKAQLTASAEYGKREDAVKGLVLAPVFNGMIRPLRYNDAAVQGQVHRVPMMIGTNKNDMTVTMEEAVQGYSRFQKSAVDWGRLMDQNGYPGTYVYFFKRELPGGDRVGAFHSAELWYSMGTLAACWRPMTEADYALSSRMVKYWTRFMKTGDPNGSELPEWRPCKENEPFEMIFDIA